VKPVGVLGGEVIGDINVVPGAVDQDAVPGVLGGAVGARIAVNNVARDILASADGGEEAGDIVANACFIIIKIIWQHRLTNWQGRDIL